MLEIKEMSHDFGGLRAVNNYALTLEPGQIRVVVVLGLLGAMDDNVSTLDVRFDLVQIGLPTAFCDQDNGPGVVQLVGQEAARI